MVQTLFKMARYFKNNKKTYILGSYEQVRFKKIELQRGTKRKFMSLSIQSITLWDGGRVPPPPLSQQEMGQQDNQ